MSMSKQDAEALAAAIRAYWATRGQFPRLWLQQEHAIASPIAERLLWAIHSDMFCGWPPGGAMCSIPQTRLKIVPGVTADTDSPFLVQGAATRRPSQNDSVRPPHRVWRDAGRGAI